MQEKVAREENDVMSFEGFSRCIKMDCKKLLSNDFDITLNVIVKDGVESNALIIHEKKLNIAPIIYLESYYELYSNHILTYDETMVFILWNYCECRPEANIDLSRISELGNAMQIIITKIV